MKPQRPLVRYHGGKWRISPGIMSYFPKHRTYSECFGGGGSILLRKTRSYAEIYNDLDGEMVNLFKMVRDHSQELSRLVLATPFARDEYREAFEATDDPIEMARRTLIRSHMGFGSNAINRGIKSGFRANCNNATTTPATDWIGLPRIITAVAQRFLAVVLENRNALEVMEQQDSSETLHYLDPPYVHSTRAIDLMHGNHGYAHEMTDEQHCKLGDVAKEMKGMVVVSGYHSPLYDRIYSEWHVVECETMADGKTESKSRTEVLWLNDAVWHYKKKRTLFTR